MLIGNKGKNIEKQGSLKKQQKNKAPENLKPESLIQTLI